MITDGAGVQMSELKSPVGVLVCTVPEMEPTVVPVPVVGLVCWMASVNITAPDGIVALPEPVSAKLPRLTTLPSPMRPGLSALGVYVSVKPLAMRQVLPTGAPATGAGLEHAGFVALVK